MCNILLPYIVHLTIGVDGQSHHRRVNYMLKFSSTSHRSVRLTSMNVVIARKV